MGKQIREHSGSCRLPPCGIEKNHAGVADCRQEDTSIDRRTVLAGVGAVVLALPLAVEAQQAAKVPRTAFLNLGSPPASDARPVGPLIERLRERGYEEGRNIAIEYRASEWKNGSEEEATDVDWRNFAVETSLAVKRGKWGCRPPREGAALTPSTPFAYTAPLSKFPRLGCAS